MIGRHLTRREARPKLVRPAQRGHEGAARAPHDVPRPLVLQGAQRVDRLPALAIKSGPECRFLRGEVSC
jgi:hypothetical protein